MSISGRTALLLLATFWLAGCTALMVGGGNGSYQPPKDQCEEGDKGCKSR